MAEPILRWGSSGPAVQRLQEALKGRGHYRGPIDGRFQSQTHNAVVAFQASRGLPMDGVVGPRTWNALGTVVTGPSQGGGNGTGTGTARGISIHIGVNRIDPLHYGTAGVLHGCENDARAMEVLARARGFEPRMLLTEGATSTAVLDAVRRAAAELQSGDILLLTYAGHGAQVPDTDQDDDDRLDETWCLYDRMLLDDELYAAWGAFKPGVRIVVLSDSCHSGTMSRGFRGDMAILKEIYYASLASEGSSREIVLRDAGSLLARSPLPRAFGDDDGGGPGLITRNLHQWIVEKLLAIHADEYRGYREAAPRAAVQATVLAISGCQDNQLSQESNGRGKFSVTLERVWAGGAFSGDYRALHRAIVAEMPPTQTPNLTVVGAPNPPFQAEQPFTIAASRAAAVEVARGALVV